MKTRGSAVRVACFSGNAVPRIYGAFEKMEELVKGFENIIESEYYYDNDTTNWSASRLLHKTLKSF